MSNDDQHLRCPECETTAFTVTHLARVGPRDTVRLRCDCCGGIVADADLGDRHPGIDAQLRPDGGQVADAVHDATPELARDLLEEMKAETPIMFDPTQYQIPPSAFDDPPTVSTAEETDDSPFDLAKADADRYRALIEDRIRQFHAKADRARSRDNPERQRAFRQAAESLEVAL